MRSLSSLHKLFIYLTGLMVTCFLHSSCQVLSSSTLGMDSQGPSAPNAYAEPIQTDRKVIELDMGFSGHPQPTSKYTINNMPGPIGQVTHDGLVHVYGHDACAVDMNKDKAKFIVADGAGWQEDSRKIAMGICETYIKQLSDRSLQSDKSLQEVFRDTCQQFFDKNTHVHKGGATVLAGDIELSSGKLKWVNIGDCNMIVIRKNKVVFHSPKQIRWFNAPYQVTRDLRALEKCAFGEFQLESGDVLIASTDCVPDSLTLEEIIVEINPDLSAQQIAEAIAAKALTDSQDPNKDTPFADEVAEGLVNGNEDAWYWVYDKEYNKSRSIEALQNSEVYLILKTLKIPDTEEGYKDLQLLGSKSTEGDSIREKRRQQVEKLKSTGIFKGGKADDITVIVAVIK